MSRIGIGYWQIKMEMSFTRINAGNVDNKDICFISYNSRGFGSMKQSYCRTLISGQTVGNKIPILCNQENFILRGNSYKISQALPGFHLIINPAIKETHDKGRAKNGMFIAVPSSIKSQVSDISPGYWRLQAVIVKIGNSRLLVINSYFPTDPLTVRFDDAELVETIEYVKKILDDNFFSSVLWLGDINCDFVRRTGHVNLIENFLNENSFIRSWNKFSVDFTRSQENENASFFSTLDHFFWDEEFNESVIDAGVLHSLDNNSDHSPVYCVVRHQNIQLEQENFLSGTEKPSWRKASEEEKVDFQNNLNQRLQAIEIPSSIHNCFNIKCKDKNHCDDSDGYIGQILDAVEVSAKESLPSKKSSPSSRKKVTPGWSVEVKPFRDKSFFWSQVWKSAGKPIGTVLHNIMKKSRNVYHYHYKKCQKSKEMIKRNRLLDACLNGGSDIFKEIKKIRKCEQIIASSMDGKTENISEHFKSIYGSLYNSTDDTEELNEIKIEVEEKLNSAHIKDVHKVTPTLVKEAASHIKDDKTDPLFSFSSDCIKNGSDLLFESLSHVIKSYLVHGHVTVFLLLATLVPIIKDKLGSINNSKNYRSIAISSLILKLIDWIILILFGDTLALDDLQFAYHPGCSTTMCTWAVVETISYFMRNGSEVYTCIMDMTKAFDLVKHSLLFRKLMKAGLSLIFVRMLLFIYIMQPANVKWNGEISSIFSLSNGVRQGGVISAILYCFYMNDLFRLLRKSSAGCWVKGYFHGIFGYSDDNFLLAPSLPALQEMLLTCEEYALAHNLKFSTDPKPSKCKTKCIAFLYKQRELPSLKLCGNNLPWVNGGKHLGNAIENKIDGMKLDLKQKRAQYITKNNELIQEFSFSHPDSQLKINQIYNSHFTGSPLWDLFSEEAIKLENTWNKSVRLMLDVHYTTHRNLIEPLSGYPHIRKVLIKRFLGFLSQIEKSPKFIPRHLLSTIKHDVRSTTGSNLRKILLLTEKSSIDKIDLADVKEVKYHQLKEDDLWKVASIKELIDIKFRKIELENFSIEEIDDMLHFLCTS